MTQNEIVCFPLLCFVCVLLFPYISKHTVVTRGTWVRLDVGCWVAWMSPGCSMDHRLKPGHAQQATSMPHPGWSRPAGNWPGTGPDRAWYSWMWPGSMGSCAWEAGSSMVVAWIQPGCIVVQLPWGVRKTALVAAVLPVAHYAAAIWNRSTSGG